MGAKNSFSFNDSIEVVLSGVVGYMWAGRSKVRCQHLCHREQSAGREIEGPMAIVILGSLLTSTGLNLLVSPTLALKYGQFEKLE